MATEHITYCRICEANCGLVATVEGDEVVQLRPDPDHPLSSGYACPKGIAFPGVQNDADRVTHPLRRTSSGDFERVSWEEALADIASRLGALPRVVDRVVPRQPRGVVVRARGVGEGVRRRARLAALLLVRLAGREQPLRGERAHVRVAVARPDPRRRADGLPARRRREPVRVERERLQRPARARPDARRGRARRARGRRRPAADRDRAALRARPVLPDGDAWLLLSMLQVIFAESLATDPAPELAALCAPFTPEETAARTGLDPSVVRALAAISLARRPRRCTAGPGRASGRTGRWSPSCSTRWRRSPATSTARAGRCSPSRRSTSTRRCRATGWRPTARGARGSAGSRTCSGSSRRR